MWQASQNRQQRGAPGRLVGLRGVPQHDGSHGVAVEQQFRAEIEPAGRGPEQVADGGEQEVGLAFGGWQREQEIDDLRVTRDASG